MAGEDSVLRLQDGGEITSIGERSISWRDGTGRSYSGTILSSERKDSPKDPSYQSRSTTTHRIRTTSGDFFNYLQTTIMGNWSGTHEVRMERIIRRAAQ